MVPSTDIASYQAGSHGNTDLIDPLFSIAIEDLIKEMLLPCKTELKLIVLNLPTI